MRKMIFLLSFLLIVVMVLFLPSNQPKQVSTPPSNQTDLMETMYIVEKNSTIDYLEAEEMPPNERWHYIKDLKNATSIIVLCHPLSFEIDNQELVEEIADSFQKSKYVEKSEYPSNEADVKLYFKKRDDFIMAGRFYLQQGVIISPEGPIIKIDLETVKKIMENADCK
ncbi:hypothetical protein ACFFF5_13380 [Lederbergia wuyishanensis]|uniref:Uncharacterized protein n=1 Tax=Lederbergia wuyishanensis TaxID=1347903 RepID=A0ABU0D518_9BACI|nr:hypothetical protein [Lederbergia wuyishanensis]MCJ8009595.1 hypothetical protein [Lederbergia wuyishanensis]MDQ0343502.1 hypothetical protein [Lederbergia wuyishanensis]